MVAPRTMTIAAPQNDFKSQLRVARNNARGGGMPTVSSADSGIGSENWDQAADTSFAPAGAQLTDEDMYRRDFRGQMLEAQINRQAGVPQAPRSQEELEEMSDPERIYEEGARERAGILLRRQRGEDTRTASAVREQLGRQAQQTFDKAFQALGEQVGKQLGKFGLTFTGEGIGAADGSSGASALVSFFVSFVWNCIGAVFTLFVPEQKYIGTPNNWQDFKSYSVGKMADVFPRFGISTPAKITASLGFLFQLLEVGIVVLFLITLFAIIYYLLSPLSFSIFKIGFSIVRDAVFGP